MKEKEIGSFTAQIKEDAEELYSAVSAVKIIQYVLVALFGTISLVFIMISIILSIINNFQYTYQVVGVGIMFIILIGLFCWLIILGIQISSNTLKVLCNLSLALSLSSLETIKDNQKKSISAIGSKSILDPRNNIVAN